MTAGDRIAVLVGGCIGMAIVYAVAAVLVRRRA